MQWVIDLASKYGIYLSCQGYTPNYPLPTPNCSVRWQGKLRAEVYNNQKFQFPMFKASSRLVYLSLLLPKLLAMASVFVTHGGGPMPLIYKEEHALFYQQLQQIRGEYPQPKAILLFSAHWEQQEWTIIDHDTPPLYYDYYGFPPETYNLTYPIRSTSELRNHVKGELKKEGVELKSNTKRGYDHGVFIPLMVMYPKADIPVIQISILNSLNPQAHFRMGAALRGLKSQGYLILGSGASVHGGFGQPESIQMSKVFDNQLTDMVSSAKSEEELFQRVKNWRKLKYSKPMHPREEHLLPLFINAGAGSGKGVRNMKLFLMGVHLSNYVFE